MDPARILLVDDQPANLHTLSRALASEWELSVATSGAAALELAEQLVPDLILLDVMMPEVDGLQTLARLRATSWGRDMPVILITADARTETQVDGLELGAEDFITKPVVVPVVQARVRNLLERHRLRHELVRRATTDELTGILNRRRFLERSQDEHRRLTRYADACGLLMLDVDHFKAINDRHGHAAGDEALRTIGAVLPSLLREQDLVGRIGGEEFALLLPHTDREGSLALAERIRRTIAQLPIRPDTGEDITLTVSIGSTQLTAADPDLETAMRRADAALYAAKAAGRDRVSDSTPTPDADRISIAR